jgi:hypothetical protein
MYISLFHKQFAIHKNSRMIRHHIELALRTVKKERKEKERKDLCM